MTVTATQPRTPPQHDLDALQAVALEAARRAGAVLREHFAAPPRDVRAKSGPTDLVSAADIAAEGEVRALLASERPGDGVLGEEHGETASQSGLRWVVDPLDGTANFLRRIPHWSVSIACEDRAGPVVGVVFDPLRGECFTAARGRGAMLDGDPLGGSAATDVRLATLGGEFTARTAREAQAVRRLVASVGRVRSFGSAALDLAWAAAGRWDAAYHGRFPAPWDVAAGALLCREAGACFERVIDPGDGQPRMLAAPPALVSPLRDLVLGRLARARA